jgi:pimeloyl-ACP methyl ester carboxylesterase
MKYLCFASILFLVLVACSQQTEQKKVPDLPVLTGKMPSGTIATRDGETIAYQLYPNPGRPGIILLHMYQRNREDLDGVGKWLQQNGYAVIAPDFRGHGLSTGTLSKFTADDYNKMVYDVEAAKAVLEQNGANTKKLSVLGASIGANVAMNYAQNDPDVKTLILLSPGVDYHGIITQYSRFNKPFLIVASKNDDYAHQSALYLKQTNPTAELLIYENAGHGTNMFQQKDLPTSILSALGDYGS